MPKQYVTQGTTSINVYKHIFWTEEISSIAHSCPTLQPHGLQHSRLPCSSPVPKACTNSCPSSWWCHPTISSFVIPFSSCLRSFPESGSFQMSQFFDSGGQSNGVSASASVQLSSVQSLSCVWLFVTPWTAAHQASLSITNSGSLLKLMSIQSVMLSNHLILCHPLLIPPSIFPNIRVFSNELALRIRWPKYWSFSFSLSLSNESFQWFPLGWTG